MEAPTQASGPGGPPGLDKARLEKTQVPSSFDRVAARYDLLQRFNPGYRRDLTESAMHLEAPAAGRLLDVCCGTGLSTQALAARYPRAQIEALDGSPGMLAVARRKRALSNVQFFQGDAMDPAACGASGPYDGVFMAYGIRNVSDPDLCLRRVAALLVPGGRLALHEYSVSGSWVAELGWRLVSSAVIVPLGTAFTGSSELFRYLRQSVLEFDSVARLCERISRAGFVHVEAFPAARQRGIVHTVVAQKPG